jgi:hypothetical protein
VTFRAFDLPRAYLAPDIKTRIHRDVFAAVPHRAASDALQPQRYGIAPMKACDPAILALCIAWIGSNKAIL